MGRLVNGTVTDNLQNKEIEKLKKEDVIVNNAIDEVKVDLFNQVITPLTPASGAINIVAGGYTKIGNLCIVNLRFNRSATTIGTLAKNLPKPISAIANYVGATVKDIGTDSQSDGYGYISNDGDAIVKVQKASSDYTFSAVYICQ